MLKHRQSQSTREHLDFSKLRVGSKDIKDVSISLSTHSKVNAKYGDKAFILNAINRHNYPTLREISKYFYESSGIYYRLCRYLAFLYRFDWYITPYRWDTKKEESKISKDMAKILMYFDKSEVKKICGNIALDVIKEGVYYGIIIDFEDRFAMQKLPADYCRSRYYVGPYPLVELNLRFFDVYFANPNYKVQILKTFPKEIQQAYVLYKQGKLKGDYPGDKSCWVPIESAVKISLNDSEFPSLVGVIPSIIDLDEAQELDRQKTMQQLLKIIVQKLPLDKNGDLIFDMEEAEDIHKNAVAMLKRAIGIDVLTTFADIEKIDTKDNNSNTTRDDLEKVERSLFNNAGISNNIFNADGNLAVTNSILADEASVRDIPLQFTGLLNRIAEKFNRPNHYEFRATMLETTQFNYKELSKLYKEQASIGYSKMLPQIALGHSQSSILATLDFENEVLHLAEIMIPPASSNVMSSKNLGNNNQSSNSKNQKEQTTTSKTSVKTEEKSSGRPEKEDSEKSDKTIANRESMS